MFNSENESMKVSVIIPFRSKVPIVEKCIESVKNQDYKNVEIIAVSDRAKYEDKHVKSFVDPRCKGPGDKRNLGVKKAVGEILFFLDSDCILKKDTISKLVKTFEEHDTDAVSGKPLTPKNSNLLGLVTGLEYEYRFDQMGENYVDVAATTCLGVRKSAFKKVGGFKDYSTGEATGEDWDFSARLRKNSFKIFHTNKVQVFHIHSSETLLTWFKRRIHHSGYRITHYKRYKQAADQYMTWGALLTATVLLNIPVAIKIYNKTRDGKVFLLPFYSFLRDIAWAIGVIVGLFK